MQNLAETPRGFFGFALSTNRCQRSRSGDAWKNPGILWKNPYKVCDSLYAQTAVNVPRLMYPGQYPGISWVHSGWIWMNLDASGKSLRNVDHGTATSNRF